MGFAQLVDQRHSLVIQLLLLDLHLGEEVHPRLRVDEFFGIQPINESPDGVVLLDLVEAHHGLFPFVVQQVELLTFVLDDPLVELVALLVLDCVLGILVLDLLLHQLVYLRLQVERDEYKLLAHATQVRSTSFFLEGPQVVKGVA